MSSRRTPVHTCAAPYGRWGIGGKFTADESGLGFDVVRPGVEPEVERDDEGFAP